MNKIRAILAAVLLYSVVYAAVRIDVDFNTPVIDFCQPFQATAELVSPDVSWNSVDNNIQQPVSLSSHTCSYTDLESENFRKRLLEYNNVLTCRIKAIMCKPIRGLLTVRILHKSNILHKSSEEESLLLYRFS